MPAPVSGCAASFSAPVQALAACLVTLSEAVGVDLFYKRSEDNPNHPNPGENDDDLRRRRVTCWQRRSRQSGKPVMNRQGALVWLGRMPLGCYSVDRTSRRQPVVLISAAGPAPARGAGSRPWRQPPG